MLPTPPPPGVHTPPIPITALDHVMRDIIVTNGLIVDARLDACKLENTITVLIERKFPRAGARIAFRNGVYEFQVPQKFSTDMPAVRFTVENHVEAYSADPSRPKLPVDLAEFSASSPTIVNIPNLEPYFCCPGSPITLAEWIESKAPLMHVHFCVFNDLTFIGITAPHVGFDGVGMGMMLQAWTRLLNGADIDEIVGMDWDSEPFKSFLPRHSPATAIPKSVFGNGQLWQAFGDPEQRHAFVRLPKQLLADWKRQIMDELQSRGSTEWVGTSDILLAWWYKETLGHRVNDTTPMHLLLLSDIRNQPIFGSATESIGQYIGNAIGFIPVRPIPMRVFNDWSVGQLALHLRRAINTYHANPARIQAGLHYAFANPEKLRLPCPAGAEWKMSTNWLAADFGGLDFSGAQIHPRGAQTNSTKARVRFVYPTMTEGRKRLPIREPSFKVLMEDEEAIWAIHGGGEKEWNNMRRRRNALETKL
ncbi:hypothetical protein FB45DRAFT_1082492 [Roridomyces roridus]|uniref:Uncharacterized protein n=1 Tax=Roridomyces roridus TaxID=1738132 RepID=A0AAD7BPZ3_9AGAR|nr:hypothetical protein FB45DRAFT_1082492 [Roridomyces roridus]